MRGARRAGAAVPGLRLAVAVAAGLLVAGCGSEAPQAASFDTTSAPPTESASPTAAGIGSPTPSPTGGTTGTGGSREVKGSGSAPPGGPKVAAVKAFMRRFIRVDNHATRTGDYAERDTMVTEGCVVCADSKRYTRRIYADGGKLVGSLFTHNSIDVFGSAGDRYLVELDTVVSAYRAYDASGRVVDRGPAEHQRYSYVVAENGAGRWQIVGGGVAG